MPKGATFINDLLKLIFQGTAITGLADNAATSPLASLYLSLHTADPTAAGNQASNEVAYTGYARVALARTSGAWTVSGSTVAPAANVEFPIGTGGSGVATHAAIGTAASGTGKLLWVGAITPNITCGNAIIPRLTTSTILTET